MEKVINILTLKNNDEQKVIDRWVEIGILDKIEDEGLKK